MNVKTNKRSLVTAVAAVVAIIACFVVAIVATPVFRKAEADAGVVIADIRAYYELGDTVTISDDAAIEYGGVKYAAKSKYLRYPSGRAVSGSSFDLDETGRYTVYLEAEAEGKKISAQKTFLVNENLYRVSDTDSYVEYGELNSYFAKGGMNKGVLVHLTDGATFSYSEPINIYENKITDILKFNLMRRDNKVEYLTIRLTDCYDPTIALDVVYWKVSMEEYVILTAGQKGCSVLGLNEAKTDSGETGKYVIDGKQYNVGVFGTEVEGNRDRADNKNVNNITLTFDTTDRQAIKIYESTDTEAHTKLVTQLNNDKLYAYKFPGFTDGNVFLSITASGFKSVKYADIEIGELMGAKNEDLNRMGKFSDKTAPSINIDVNEADDKIYVGTAARIPSANAYDASGIGKDVDYTVWYNYFGKPKSAVAVKDGKFTPAKSGAYTIVYTAEDIYGNVAEKLLTLRTVGSKEKGIDISIGDTGVVYAGSTVNLRNYTINSLCKKQSVDITLITPDGESVKVSSDAYLVEKAGKYTVTYEFGDAYYEGSEQIEFTAEVSRTPVFEKSYISVPRYFIKGANYSVEKVSAFIYDENGKSAVETLSYISYDEKDFVGFDSDDFVVGDAATVRVKYVCSAYDGVYIESDTITIADVGYGTKNFSVADYFRGDFTGESDLSKTTYRANKSGKANLDFINPVLRSAFALDFLVDGGATGMSITFTDFYDSSKTATLELRSGGGAKTYSVNGESGSLLAPWSGSRTKIGATGSGLRIGDDLINCDFGFTSDLCLISVGFDGVESGFEFEVYTLCNQTFKKAARDVMEPMISVEEPDKIMNKNEICPTAVPCVADVLSPSPLKNVTLSVYLDGKIFTDENGKAYKSLAANMSYDVKLSSYGTYLFVYEYSDGAENFVDMRADVQVIDDVAPVAEFKEKPNGTVKVKCGQKITPLDVVVSDNETDEKDISVWAIVYDERGRLVTYVKKSNEQADRYSFVLNEKGKYTVYVYCSDATGNTAYLTYGLQAE